MSADGRGGSGPRRARAWLGAAMAVLLVATYVVVGLTYDQVHLPPYRYDQLAPGAAAEHEGADFTLLRLRQTTQLGHDDDGGPVSPDPGSVWLVADLSVTRHERQQYFDCNLTAVSTDRRVWDANPGFVDLDGDDCPPDDAKLGRAYPVVVYFEVPDTQAGRIAGLALSSYSWRPAALLVPR